MERAFIEQVRSFNRAVTLGTGALNDSYLGRGRPLGQARMLFEIGPDGTDIRSLRERLGLDLGYASRLLRSLEAEGLIAIESDVADRRRRLVTLTAKGLAERAAYEALSDDLAKSLLDALSEEHNAVVLVAAMADVERLMNAASVTIAAEPEDSRDARQCVAAYYKELDERFEGGFDPGSGGYAGTPADASVFLVARLHGRAVGCGALKLLDSATAEIKRMWVAPDARGLGIAGRLLEALENQARHAGASRVVLDTNRALLEAQAMYRKAGYRETGRYNDNAYADLFFEKALAPAS